MRVLAAFFLAMFLYSLVVPGHLGAGFISLGTAVFVGLVARRWQNEDSGQSSLPKSQGQISKSKLEF